MALREALEKGLVRAAEPDGDAPLGWRVNGWVKQGILLGFRLGVLVGTGCEGLAFVETHFPARRSAPEDGVRIVGGSAIRAGAFVARGVVCAPPMYINTGAYVDEGTMVDSHALVGSCAQIGKRVHLSAAAQIGGVLEPVNAAPVVIEDEVWSAAIAALRGNAGPTASSVGSWNNPPRGTRSMTWSEVRFCAGRGHGRL